MLGWRGFDPTIGNVTGANDIVTGVGTHPVMPVSGTLQAVPSTTWACR